MYTNLFSCVAVSAGVHVAASCAQWSSASLDSGESAVWSAKDHV